MNALFHVRHIKALIKTSRSCQVKLRSLRRRWGPVILYFKAEIFSTYAWKKQILETETLTGRPDQSLLLETYRETTILSSSLCRSRTDRSLCHGAHGPVYAVFWCGARSLSTVCRKCFSFEETRSGAPHGLRDHVILLNVSRERNVISITDFGRKSKHFYDEESLVCVPCGTKYLRRSLRTIHIIIEVVLSSLPWIFLITYGIFCVIISILYGYWLWKCGHLSLMIIWHEDGGIDDTLIDTLGP